MWFLEARLDNHSRFLEIQARVYILSMFVYLHLHLGIHELSLMESCPSLPVLGLHAMPAQGLPEAQRYPQEGKMPTAAQFISLPSSAPVVPLAISTPYFPHTSHSHDLLFLPKSLSHQEGQGKVLCQIVTQEKSECAHVSYIIFTLSLPFFSINSNHPPTAVHLGFSHDSWQI